MTQSTDNSEQAVTALFAERQRFEGWLAALDAKRSATPPHIYDRVHGDYEARLQRVIEQLAAYQPVLEQIESTLTDRLTSLDIDEAKQRDEATEAELRAAIGELNAAQHQEVLARTGAAVAALSASREQVSAELARVRSIFDGTGASGAAAAATTASANAPAGGVPGPASPARRIIASPIASPIEHTELAFEGPTHGVPAAGANPTSTSRSAGGDLHIDQSSDASPFDDLEFLRSVTDARPSGETAGARNGAERPAATTAAAEEISVAHLTRDLEGGSERAGGVEQVKTLRCQECSTLNYPTEWYCERCGAELAAL